MALFAPSRQPAHDVGSARASVRDTDTLPCGAQYISRGEDIECWLDRKGRPNYVIIDDLDDFFPSQHDRYVETNPIVGITDANAIKAIEILKSNL